MKSSNNCPLISVVVPSYNHAQFIQAALQSVGDQTYKQIELIVIDDCSSDETVTLAAEWLALNGSKLAYTRLLRNQRNLGADTTINCGVRASKGRFVTILNSDDMFIATRLERMLSALTSSNGSLAFSKVAGIDEAGALLLPATLPKVLQGAFEQADRSRAIDPAFGFGFLRGNLAISTGNILFSRELYDRLDGFRSLKYVHDWDFILRALVITEPIYVEEELYLYRLHGSNSFSQLADVAEIETEVVLSTFRRLLRQGPVLNRLAPTNYNWPGLLGD
jgi:glycosyltransferase involved in cell wall biosynthesis